MKTRQALRAAPSGLRSVRSIIEFRVGSFVLDIVVSDGNDALAVQESIEEALALG